MVTARRSLMIHSVPRMARIGVTGYPGTLNPRGSSGYGTPFYAADDRQPATAEIATATVPLPELMRAGAAVVRLDASGKPEPLRPGSNGMVCIADLPGDDEFDVRCYNEQFIEVVYRSFQLRRQVGSHDHRRRAVEGERRLEHPLVAKGHQVGDAGGFLRP